MRILTLTKETQQNILENLLKRSPNSYGEYEGRAVSDGAYSGGDGVSEGGPQTLSSEFAVTLMIEKILYPKL